jgi:hypothetical protein
MSIYCDDTQKANRPAAMESNDAAVVRFPMRRSLAVWITRDGPAWLVLAGEHGWLHGSRQEADRDAQWLGRNLNLPVRAVAP